MILEEVKAIKVSLGDGLEFTTKLGAWRLMVEFRYVRDLYVGGERVKAIKHAREVFGCGLKEAKYFAEQAAEYNNGQVLWREQE